MKIEDHMDSLEQAGAKICNIFEDDSKFHDVCSILFQFQKENDRK